MLFNIVDNAFVILRSNGVYRQAKVFRRGTALYAQWGAGFIGLRQTNERGSTTHPLVSWEHIEGVSYMVGTFGQMDIREDKRAKAA